MSDWKQRHANDAEKALDHELVQRVMKELADNLSSNPDVASKGWESDLFQYGLRKVVTYAAQVARAQALGFDPDLLRLSSEEADEAMLRKAQMAVEAGRPVFVVVEEG